MPSISAASRADPKEDDPVRIGGGAKKKGKLKKVYILDTLTWCGITCNARVDVRQPFFVSHYARKRRAGVVLALGQHVHDDLLFAHWMPKGLSHLNQLLESQLSMDARLVNARLAVRLVNASWANILYRLPARHHPKCTYYWSTFCTINNIKNILICKFNNNFTYIQW